MLNTLFPISQLSLKICLTLEKLPDTHQDRSQVISETHKVSVLVKNNNTHNNNSKNTDTIFKKTNKKTNK